MGLGALRALLDAIRFKKMPCHQRDLTDAFYCNVGEIDHFFRGAIILERPF